MSHTIRTLLRRLRGTTEPAGSDADLLERFARTGDGVAFAELVARHGPVVLGVCRRLLGDAHDAEDAFQATFLVLARRAGALGRGDPVGAWLYGVACRVAAHARADRARRTAHERRATAMPAAEPTPAVLWDDLRPVLDEEVQRLPDKYRVAVVLCYLGGKTYDEAAHEIGCPKGTVATRLAKARELLCARLSARGVTLPTALLATVLADRARAAVPAALLLAAVEAVAPHGPSAAVAALAAGVLKAMPGLNLKAVTALLAAAALLAAGAGALAFRAPAGDRGPDGTDPALKGAPAAEPPWGDPDAGVQVRLRAQRSSGTGGELPAFDLDVRNGAKQARTVYPPVCLWALWEVEVDGTWYGRKNVLPPGVIEETPPKHLLDTTKVKPFGPGDETKGWAVLRLDGRWLRGVRGEKRVRSDAPEEALALAPGKHTIRVAYHHGAGFCPVSNPVEIEVAAAGGKDDPGWIRVRTWAGDKTLLFRPDGTGRTEAKADPEGRILSPDGKSILSVTQDNDQTAVHVADADGKNARLLSADGVVAHSPVWSPDGKQVGFLARFDGKMQVHLVGRDGKNLRKLTDGPHGAGLPKFGPDGRLAYLLLDGKLQPSALMVIDDRLAKTETLVRDVLVTGYAWSPDGTSIAYGKPGVLVFHDLKGGKRQEVALTDIDRRLTRHGPSGISWGPDGRGVACVMTIQGPRAGSGPGVPRPFGDDEVFVIPRAGKATWFTTGKWVRDVEWLKDNPAKERGQPPAAPEPPLATGAWSEPVDGLRGRLLLGQGRDLPDLKARETLVYVEVESVTHTHAGERAVYFDPGALRCKLTDADGKAVAEHPFGGSGGRGGPPAGWVTIPDDALMRLRVNPSGYGSPDGLHIALVNAHFLIKTGDANEYHLSGTLTVALPAGHGRADAWAGVVKLPPVKVKGPAPARPTVTDAASGITIAVQEDGRTIVARGKDGKQMWESDVIKTAGIPFVGQPVVRELHLKDGKVTAIYGKHSFADYDLATGKFLGAGSD